MRAWLYVALTFVAWFAFSLAPAARKAFEDRGLPADQKRGTSFFPAFPLFPLLASGLLRLVGTGSDAALAIASLHGLLLLAALAEVARWSMKLRRTRK